MTVRIATNEPHLDGDLLPVRMCNEVVYCPRLFYLEHVMGVFVESAETVEGSAQHARTAKRTKRKAVAQPASAEDQDLLKQLPTTHSFRSSQLGIAGKVDLLEVKDGSVEVVEHKRGRAPTSTEHRWGDFELSFRAWPADVVQVAAYMALVRAHGLPCDEARLYYRKCRTTTSVPWSTDLDRLVSHVVAHARRLAAAERPPVPLVDSPKCPGCSLHAICLPDEHHALAALEQASQDVEVRRIIPGRDDKAIIHVLSPGSVVRKDGDGLVVETRTGEKSRHLSKDVSHVAVFSRSSITTPCLTHLLLNGIPISYHTGSGRLLGVTHPLSTRNITLRRAQFRAAEREDACLEAARAFVLSKIRNQRTLLRRYRGRGETKTDLQAPELPDWAQRPEEVEREVEFQEQAGSRVKRALDRLKRIAATVNSATSLDQLRGHEGDAAARYFEALPLILPITWRGLLSGRSRRPPKDPVNAMLSFSYALLVKDSVAALARIGLDPMLGFFHSMIPGRPALALDVMEPFRPAWADAAVLRLIATRGIDPSDFVSVGGAISMKDSARRSMISAYERRADELVTHPRFGYRMSYRRILELEARILAKWFVGEIDSLAPMVTR